MDGVRFSTWAPGLSGYVMRVRIAEFGVKYNLEPVANYKEFLKFVTNPEWMTKMIDIISKTNETTGIKGLQNIRRRYESSTWHVAEDISSNEIVGVVAWWDAGKITAEIYLCGVHPDYRLRGIGKKLLSMALDAGKQANCSGATIPMLINPELIKVVCRQGHFVPGELMISIEGHPEGKLHATQAFVVMSIYRARLPANHEDLERIDNYIDNSKKSIEEYERLVDFLKHSDTTMDVADFRAAFPTICRDNEVIILDRDL